MAKKPTTLSNSAVASVLASRLLKVKAKKGDPGVVEVNIQKQLASTPKYYLDMGLPAFEDMASPLPFGRLIAFSGLEASGKTSMGTRAAVRAQQGYIYKLEDGKKVFLKPEEYNITVLIIDNERSLANNETIIIDGVKLDILHEDEDGNITGSVIVTNAETIDLTFKLLDQTMLGLEELQEKESKLQLLVCIVDTFNGTASSQELTQDWGKEDFARQPKQMSEALRNIMQRVARQNTMLIGINQVRENMQYQPAGYVSPFAEDPDPEKFRIPGGKAMNYWGTLHVLFYQIKKKYVLEKGAQFQAGLLIGFRSLKNRLRPGFRTGRFTILFGKNGGIRHDFSLLESLLYLGFAELDPADKETIIFKFKRNGLTPTTFNIEQNSLEDEDESPQKGRYKDPRIPGRAAWPKFYTDHKSDMDMLWDAAVKYAYTVQGLDNDLPVVVDEDEEITVDSGRSIKIAELG